MSNNKNNIEEKSFNTSIEFSYNEKKSLFSFIKKLKINFASIIVLIIAILLLIYSYGKEKITASEYNNLITEYEKIKTTYDDLKGKIKNIENIKVNNINGDKLIKIFNYLLELNIDYTLIQNKKTNNYEVDINDYDIDKLEKFIEKGINEGILSLETKKELIISSPGKGSIKLIFNQ